MEEQEILDSLAQTFPIWAARVDWSEGNYCILGDFAIFLKEEIVEDRFSELDKKNLFAILNKMGETRNLEVQNLLMVGIFEVIADFDKVAIVLREHLSPHALSLFEEVLARR